MKVAIMQPTYLPWMGYFGLINAVDVFVILDDVQFVHRSWQRRNRIKMAEKAIWLSVPVQKKFGQNINEVKISNTTNWASTHITSIIHAYRKTKYFEDYIPYLNEIYEREWVYLAKFNTHIIKLFCDLLKITTLHIHASELNIEGTKTDRLINILNKIGGDEYVSPPGSRVYIEDHKFIENDIELLWFEYNHPTYSQMSNVFISHLSIVDLLFNNGPDSLNYIIEGTRNALVKT